MGIANQDVAMTGINGVVRKDVSNAAERGCLQLNHVRLAEVLNFIMTKVVLEYELVCTVPTGKHIVRTSQQDIRAVSARKGLVTESSIDDGLAIASRDCLARRP
jgi:hypothetical protein